MDRIRRYGYRGLALVLVMLAAASGGCTSPAKFTPSTGSEKFPPYEGEVRVLEHMPSSGQFDRVGVVVVEGVQLTAEEAMVASIRERAAEKGANAVVLQGPVKVTKNSDGGIRKTLAAWAIRLKR